MSQSLDVIGQQERQNQENQSRNFFDVFREYERPIYNLASIGMVAETEATGKVKEIYDDIMATHGIDFVPNMYKAMAAKPIYLEANWNRIKAIMQEPGKLDKLTRRTEKRIHPNYERRHRSPGPVDHLDWQ
jgi:hypothetical protein